MFAYFQQVMEANRSKEALVEPGGAFTYGDILDRIAAWQEALKNAGVQKGAVVSVEGDYGYATITAFLALTEAGAVVVPLSADSAAHIPEFLEIAEVEFRVSGPSSVQPTGHRASHPFYNQLRAEGAPGLVLFTSGSTGKNKAAVHNLAKLLKKFTSSRHSWRTLVFLQLDHIGGVNTLLYTLSNAGTIIVAAGRSPTVVAESIQRHRIELLPTSPTFLNLLLLSGAVEQFDLSSLKLITYGTEAMPESTLEKATRAFTNARFQQTYGLTEVGILRSQSRASGSLWVRVGGEGYQTKVIDGRLWVRAQSAMLGYLNAPSPFDSEGFFDTGDRVEVDGEWLRILGRESDVINVGGSKVYPAEVESILLEMDNIVDVTVHGEPNAIAGQIVVALVRLEREESPEVFKARMRSFCQGRLAGYKIPARVRFATGSLHSERYKRKREKSAVV